MPRLAPMCNLHTIKQRQVDQHVTAPVQPTPLSSVQQCMRTLLLASEQHSKCDSAWWYQPWSRESMRPPHIPNGP